MEKYQIKKAGIGMKMFSSDLKRRVFENKQFGLCYILFTKYFKEEALGYPAVVLSDTTGIIHPFLVYVPEDAETWAGEITTESGEKVNYIDTTIYF